MMEMVVWHEGLPENVGKWVLAVDAAESMFLFATDEGEFYWRSIPGCRLLRVVTPENPRLVMPVQAQPKGGLVVPNIQNGRHQ